jgi:hypothetical protein
MSSTDAPRPSSGRRSCAFLRGEDTDPGATVFQVFSSTCDTLHEPIIADIDFELDIDGRTARAHIDGVVEMRGAPILNPVTGAEHRGQFARIHLCQHGMVR